MTKAILLKKQEEVSKVAEELKSAASVVVVDYLGLTVEEVTNLRKELRDNGVQEVKVKTKPKKIVVFDLGASASSLELPTVSTCLRNPG